VPADRDAPAARPVPSRVLPAVLLAAVVLLGLRGAIAAPRWDGPLHAHGTAVGVAFEAVLAALLTATLVRDRRAARRPGPQQAAVARLRGWLRTLLIAGLIAVAVLLLVDAHLHLFTKRPLPRRPVPRGSPPIRPPGAAHLPPGAPSGSAAPVLYGLLIAVLVAAAVFGLVWALRQRRPAPVLPPGEVDEDTAGLREAVASGSAALRDLDDARAAIIACYLAMERSLAEAGTARAAADTPDELLARATARGTVHGGAAERLTGLFYEARFSSHPLTRADRERAARSLDELAAGLRADGAPGAPGAPGEPGTPATGPEGRGAGSTAP